jgi:hypothetical protein
VPTPTLIYNSETNTIPLMILLQPSGITIPLPPGIDLTFALLEVDSTGTPTGDLSSLGTAAIGSDGTSVAVTPTMTGQFGFALLQTTASPSGRSGATAVVATLFLLFIDQVDTIVYDTANIVGGPLQH